MPHNWALALAPGPVAVQNAEIRPEMANLWCRAVPGRCARGTNATLVHPAGAGGQHAPTVAIGPMRRRNDRAGSEGERRMDASDLSIGPTQASM